MVERPFQFTITSFHYEDNDVKENTSAIPIIGLFCGAGGLDEGFRQAGFTTILAADKSNSACITFKRNHPNAEVRHWDLSAISPEEVVSEIRSSCAGILPVGVVGGPPCQAFSQSNVFKSDSDPRAALPRNYARIVGALRDAFGIQFFLFENVFGLKHKRHREQLESFRTMFGDAGFHIFESELDAQDFGVPQQRRRLFIVGLNKDLYPNPHFTFPIGDGRRLTVRQTIGSLPEPKFFSKELTSKDIPFHPNHWCMNPKSAKFTSGTLAPGQIKGRPFRVLDWDTPSWTVAYGHREVHIHPNCKRRLSILEAMLLQSFPKDYELRGTLTQQITLVSDAVPPLLARALAQQIKSHVKHDARQNRVENVLVRSVESMESDLLAAAHP